MFTAVRDLQHRVKSVMGRSTIQIVVMLASKPC
jgi:hypothetical protein